MRRRTVLGSAAAALAAAPLVRPAAAQEATPAAMAGHPMVGTWVVDRDTTTTAEGPPSVAVYTADGGLLDPSQGVAGAWRATGPRSAAWTLVVFPPDGPPGYLVVRSTGEVDAGGDALDSPYSFTLVGADGTVLASGRGMSRYSRLPIEPVEAEGAPLAGFPTWEPTPAAAATPAA